jgi:hypothetical protein
LCNIVDDFCHIISKHLAGIPRRHKFGQWLAGPGLMIFEERRVYRHKERILTFSCSRRVMLTPALLLFVLALARVRRANAGLSLSHLRSPSCRLSSSILSSNKPFIRSPALGVLTSSSVGRRVKLRLGVEGRFVGPVDVELLVIVVEPVSDNGAGLLFNGLIGLLKDSSREPREISGIVLLESWLSSPGVPKLRRYAAMVVANLTRARSSSDPDVLDRWHSSSA